MPGLVLHKVYLPTKFEAYNFICIRKDTKIYKVGNEVRYKVAQVHQKYHGSIQRIGL